MVGTVQSSHKAGNAVPRCAVVGLVTQPRCANSGEYCELAAVCQRLRRTKTSQDRHDVSRRSSRRSIQGGIK